MSNWSLDFNLRARTVRHSDNRKDIKMEGPRSKEGKELIISSQKYTRNAICVGRIFSEGSLLTSMERSKIAKAEKRGEYKFRRTLGERSKGKYRQTLTGEHNGGGISAECILQQPSERRVSIRDVSSAWPTSGWASLGECGYHVP